jgi:CBS domain-containing protein
MRCQELMKTDVECVSPQDTVQVAARKMRDHNVGFLPVCDQSKKVLGTITDRDIVIRVVAENRPASTPVSECMTREVVACRPEDDVRKAEQLMAQNHKSRIMVIDEAGRLVGVISLSDLAQHDKGHAAQTMKEVSERESKKTPLRI